MSRDVERFKTRGAPPTNRTGSQDPSRISLPGRWRPLVFRADDILVPQGSFVYVLVGAAVIGIGVRDTRR